MAKWALRDVLVAYLEQMKDSVAEQYNNALQVWASKTAFGGKVKPPEIPALLK